MSDSDVNSTIRDHINTPTAYKNELTRSNEELKKVQTSCSRSKSTEESILVISKKTGTLVGVIDGMERKDRLNNILYCNLADNEVSTKRARKGKELSPSTTLPHDYYIYIK